MEQKAGYRHGDVMLLPAKMTDELGQAFEGAVAIPLVVAHHNDVGHDHTLRSDGARTATLNGVSYFDIGANAYLNHPEHGRLQVAAGLYEKRMEEEYDPFEQAMRQVID